MREIVCPVCGKRVIVEFRAEYLSMTVRCTNCDASLGICRCGTGTSVVYTETPEEEWVSTVEANRNTCCGR